MSASTEQSTRFHDLLAPLTPERMVARVADLNVRRGKQNGWKFGLSDFSALPAPPANPEDWQSSILGLGVWLDTPARTLSESCLAVASGRAYSYRNPVLEQADMPVNFQEGDGPFEPGILFWFHLNPVAYLDRESGRTLEEVAEKATAASERLAHIHIPWAADQNPDWLRAIAEGTLPPVDLSGCRVTTPDCPDASGAPFMDVDGGGSDVDLHVCRVSSRDYDCAAPVIREYK